MEKKLECSMGMCVHNHGRRCIPRTDCVAMDRCRQLRSSVLVKLRFSCAVAAVMRLHKYLASWVCDPAARRRPCTHKAGLLLYLGCEVQTYSAARMADAQAY